jgi:O-antigen ligase
LRSRADSPAPATPARTGARGAIRDNAALWAAFAWGACAFFPVGVAYLNLVAMLVALSIAPDIRSRLGALVVSPLGLPIALMVIWTAFVAFVGGQYPETATRLFHVCRVALVLAVGLLLRKEQTKAAFAGFVVGASMAVLIVSAHHLWGLPDWAIWSSLLASRNNFSSSNMISLAVAAGLCLLWAGSRQALGRYRWLALLLALAFALTVVLHGISRNAQLLLVALMFTVAIYRFRSLKAVAAALLAIALMAAVAWQYSPATHQRFAQMANDLHAVETESNYMTSTGVRLRMYEVASQGMMAHPVFGTGLGSWLTIWRTVSLPIDAQLPPGATKLPSEINNPHNDYLLAGMETGVPGMLLLIWLVAGFIITGWRKGGLQGGTTVVISVAIATTALVNAPFRDAAFGMTWLWLLGASASYCCFKDA